MKPELDYDLVMAAAADAANHNMRANNRKHWNQEDWNIACKTAGELMNSETYTGNVKRGKL